jgi:hypothetical protein
MRRKLASIRLVLEFPFRLHLPYTTVTTRDYATRDSQSGFAFVSVSIQPASLEWGSRVP